MNPERNKEGVQTKKEEFLLKLRTTLDERVGKQLLTQDQADEKIESARMIAEATLPEDIEKAAQLFASSGNADEQELTRILKKE